MLISVSMALEALSDAVSEVKQKEVAWKDSMAVRDDLIRNAMDGDVPLRRLVAITGLSRDRLYTIYNSPSKRV